MYTIFSILFLIGVLMVVAGFLGRVGTDGLSDVSANVAASIGLLVTYAFLILSVSSFSDLVPTFQNLCGGIPYLKDIADYGSLRNLLHQDPLAAAISFMDTVILSAVIELILMLPLTKGDAKGKGMVDLFTGIVVAIISLLILNYVIKASSVYQWIVAALGSVIALISLGSVPALIIAKLKKNSLAGIGLIGALLLFSRSKIMGVLRSSFLKAVIFTLGILLLEKQFGSIADGMSVITAFLVAFGPVLVMIIGLVIILRSVKIF